jgi:hypothetical protein
MNFQSALSQGHAQTSKLTNPLTAHAAIRAQQRGVNRSVLDCLLQYGRHEHDHMGCEVVTFDGETLDEVARREPHTVWRAVAEARSVYAVVSSNGSVVTTGHRLRKVLRDRSLSSNRPGRSRRPRILHSSSNRYRFV